MMTLNIVPTPSVATVPPNNTSTSKPIVLRLRYTCSSGRSYLVGLLSGHLDTAECYRVFADLERSSRIEARQPLLIDLRRHRSFYRAPDATAPDKITSATFERNKLNVQLSNHLLAEMHTYLTDHRDYLTSLAGNLTAGLIKSLHQSDSESVGITPFQIRMIEQYTEDHMDRLVTLDELARVVGLSSFHFARQFKQTTGETPYQYVVRLKMKQAQQQLLGTDDSVIQIGMQVGYDNPSHFSRAFKRTMGVSPTQLRKTQRNHSVRLSA